MLGLFFFSLISYFCILISFPPLTYFFVIFPSLSHLPLLLLRAERLDIPEHFGISAFLGKNYCGLTTGHLLQHSQPSLQLPLRIVFRTPIAVLEGKQDRLKGINLGAEEIQIVARAFARSFRLLHQPPILRPQHRTRHGLESSGFCFGLQASADLGSNVVDVLHDGEDKHLSRAAGAFAVGKEIYSLSPPSLCLRSVISRVLSSIQSPAEPVAKHPN